MVMQSRYIVHDLSFDVAGGLTSDADIILPVENIEKLTDEEILSAIRVLIPHAIAIGIDNYCDYIDYAGSARGVRGMPDNAIDKAICFFSRYASRSDKAYRRLIQLEEEKAHRTRKTKAIKRKRNFSGVYVLQSGDKYKIGMSQDVKKRVSALKQGLPPGSQLVQTIKTKDAHTLEKSLHERFQDKRLGKSEWFVLDADDVAWLTQGEVPHDAGAANQD